MRVNCAAPAAVFATFVGLAAAVACSDPPVKPSAHIPSSSIEETTTTATTVTSTTVTATTVASTVVASTIASTTTEAPVETTTTGVPATDAPAEEVPTTEAQIEEAPSPEPAAEPAAAELPQAAPVVPFAVASSSTAGEFFDMTNASRAAIGVSPLRYSSQLEAYAQDWARVMANAGTIFHSDISSLLGSWSSVGENVGVGPNATTINAALRASPPHYANISYSGFTAMGVGVVTDGGGRIYTAHVFAA